MLAGRCWMPATVCGSARVRYDKTTDAISDRSPHKYAGYLTPLLPIAAASPDCQPRPLATPKTTPTFPIYQATIQNTDEDTTKMHRQIKRGMLYNVGKFVLFILNGQIFLEVIWSFFFTKLRCQIQFWQPIPIHKFHRHNFS